jgi:hypothetical protein
VRDEASAALLKEIGVPAECLRLTADPAFLFEPASTDRAAEILASEGVAESEMLVGVAIRNWTHEVDQAAWESEMAAGLDLFLRRHENARIVFLPFQELAGEQEDDLRASRRVHERMQLRGKASVFEQSYTPQEKAALLGRCKLVAAMRLHAVIFSASAGVPFVALTYDEKVRQVLRRLERSQLGIETTALRSALLVAKMEAALELPPIKTSHLAELARENTRAVKTALAQGSRAVKPLDGESLALVREGLLSLLAEQKRLRAWLRDQQTNYEYQVGEQRKEIATLRGRVEELDGLLQAERGARESEELAHRETRDHLSRLERELALNLQHLAETRAKLAATTRQFEETEKNRQEWEQKAGALTAELAALKTLHESTVADWNSYADEMDRKLAEYREQRAWRGMLALRKAYVLWERQGWRFRMIPWVWSVLRGGGTVESEQLEFPVRPAPREKQ